jgi:hypothetical protein
MITYGPAKLYVWDPERGWVPAGETAAIWHWHIRRPGDDDVPVIIPPGDREGEP